ncbi:MAG: hypothetical protein ABI673_01055 [Novosphingobium sp.]
MRAFGGTAFAILLLTAQPGQAAASDPKPAEKPVGEKDASAVDVAATPASDLNLRKTAIPQVLLDAQVDPYTLYRMTRCPQIVAAITELDGVLGDDIDVAEAKSNKLQAGRVAQSVVGSFIPFRGIIREVSGANGQDRKLQAAILAGTARRSFLKGIGQQRGCAWPARSATTAIFTQIQTQRQGAQDGTKTPATTARQPASPAPSRNRKRTGR